MKQDINKLVFLSLGSNVGDRYLYIKKAISLLEGKIAPIKSCSKIYETKAWGFKGFDFLNICLSFYYKYEPKQLLEELLSIENQLGRVRDGQSGYQSRTIDIDILFFGQEILNTADLVIPHPKLHLRKFVLEPLYEIEPKLEHPIFKANIEMLLSRLS